MAEPKLVICEGCDSVFQRAPLARRQAARCPRCGTHLYSRMHANVDAMLALTLASLVAFVVANSFPIARLESQGRSTEATLWQAIIGGFESGAAPAAAVAALTVFFFPLLQMCLFAWLLLPLRFARVPAAFVAVLHGLQQMRPWVMVEVFMLGALVAVVKLSGVATVEPRIGLWGFAALTLLLTALNSYELEGLWLRAAAEDA